MKIIITKTVPDEIPKDCIGLYAGDGNITRKLHSGGEDTLATSFDVAAVAGDVAAVAGDVAAVAGDVAAVAGDVAALSSEIGSLLPAGIMLPYAGASAPSGWLLCAGQAVSRTTYAALFTAISTTFGAGDGSTTFNIPDLRGRVVAGKDDMGGSAASRLTTGGSGVNGATLGAVGGAETHTLTTAQMPTHNHTATDSGHAHGANLLRAVAGTTATASGSSTTWGNTDTGYANITVGNAGSGNAHNNAQPTIVTNYIIKV